MTTNDLIRAAALAAALAFLPSCDGDCDDDDTGAAPDDDACDDDTATTDDDTTPGDDDTGDDDTTPGDDDTGDDDTTAAVEPPDYFIEVVPDPTVGTTEAFWIAKYEMKILGHDDGDTEYDEAYTAESRPGGIPWQWINQEQARAECEALGEGFALPTNAEWMTVARSIEASSRNWSDNQTHPSGTTDAQLNVGHTCRKGTLGVDCRMDQYPYSGEGLPASIDDEEGLYGYVQGDYEAEAPALDENGWSAYRRTFYLADDQVIWDFGGSVWEWVDWSVPLAADRANYGDVTDDYLEINLCQPTAEMPEESFKSLNTEMTGLINANRVGRYHPTSVDDDAGAAMRGGNFMHGSCNNGIYALGMGYSPDTDHIICRVGFRCVWHAPQP